MNTELDRAIRFAAEAHAGQFRDGEHALPYITHPIDVLQNLRYIGHVTDPAILVAGVLHDVAEETSVTVTDLTNAFGPEVGALVQSVTRREPSDAETAGMTKDQVWELRSSILLEEIAGMDDRAQTIKLADRLSNLREAHRTRTPKKLERYISQTERILDIIPRKVNAPLYRAIRRLLDQGPDQP